MLINVINLIIRPGILIDPETATAVEQREVKDKEVHPPYLSFLELFRKFLSFGVRAFGGPMAQIAMMKVELVDEEDWISQDRWNRVYSLYQIVPGPEAFELACYFGFICRGRFGAFLGGLGFALPGVLLELLCSWYYYHNFYYHLVRLEIHVKYMSTQALRHIWAN
jgi:chromate transport protein ChrA